MAYSVNIVLQGITPYSQSRMHTEPKLEKESHDEYDERTWMSKAYIDSNSGQLYCHPMALKQALDSAAAYNSERIPGKGQSTYTKHIKSGVLIFDPLYFFKVIEGDDGNMRTEIITREDIYKDRIYANTDGVRGSGKRVFKNFPEIHAGWYARGIIHVVDHVITPDKLRQYLEDAGQYIGIGRFRPQNGGYKGRFDIYKFDVKEN